MIPDIQTVILFSMLIVALTIHEFAHAWSASLLGDDFSKRQGRVSLWPHRHLSLMGTLAFFILRFGWGKPVQVNLYNFKHPKRDYLLTSLAGPASNLVTVGVCFLLMLLTRHTYYFGQAGEFWLLYAHLVLMLLALISAILAVINLLPIPPLDGSKIWPCVIPGMKPTLKPNTTRLFVGILIVLIYTNQLGPFFKVVQDSVMGVMPVSQRRQIATLIPESLDLIKKGDDAREKGDREEARKNWALADTRISEVIKTMPWVDKTLSIRAYARMRLGANELALDDINRAIAILPNEKYIEFRTQLLKVLNVKSKPVTTASE